MNLDLRLIVTNNGGNKLFALSNFNGNTWTFNYDQYGRLTNTANPLGQAKAYQYDKMSRVAEVKDPAGNITQYTYDALNRLTGIVNPQGITVAFGYDAAGRRTSKKIFKAAPALLAEAEYNYDAAGQLTEIVNKAGNKVVAFNKYQYDANGNRNRIEDQDGVWNYKYDAANRLIVAIPWPVDYVKAEAFVYDKNGNRRYDKTAWDYHYDAANRLVENSTYTDTHDANGNLTARTNRFDNSQFTYAYTPEQQLSDVTTPEHKVQYKYDPLGRRTEKVVDGKTIKFIYDGQDIIAELDANANQINTYTNGPGIDEPLIMTKADGKAYYYHADALGSIKAITDDNAAVVETYKYKAYGQPTIRDPKGQNILTSIIGNTRMFAAREYEQEIGLYNNRRRYLDPSRGAFTQEDPIAFGGGNVNVYSYVANSPVVYSDPTGLFWEEAGLWLRGYGWNTHQEAVDLAAEDFSLSNAASIIYAPKLEGEGRTTGAWGTKPNISIGPDAFTLINTGWLASSIGHELVHASDFFYGHQMCDAEAEVRAYGWELSASYSKQWYNYFNRKELISRYNNAYNQLPNNLQKKYHIR